MCPYRSALTESLSVNCCSVVSTANTDNEMCDAVYKPLRTHSYFSAYYKKSLFHTNNRFHKKHIDWIEQFRSEIHGHDQFTFYPVDTSSSIMLFRFSWTCTSVSSSNVFWDLSDGSARLLKSSNCTIGYGSTSLYTRVYILRGVHGSIASIVLQTQDCILAAIDASSTE